MINQNIKQLSDLNENLKQACNALDDAQKKLEEQGNYYLKVPRQKSLSPSPKNGQKTGGKS